MSHPEQVARNDKKNKKTLSSYVLGFVLSLVLTLAAFRLAEQHLLTGTSLYIALTFLALMQLGVQSLCFLRLNMSEEGRWNLFPFLFSIFIIAILAGGSLWIMYHLNINMQQ
jgi:cytochrome o ubiquinol oxidase subunit IV